MNVKTIDAQKLFGLFVVGYAALILVTFLDYGITTDEHNHVKYGADVIRWYSSGFQEQEALSSRNTYLYGGLFDTLAHLSSRILPLGPYDASHLCNAFLGLLGCVAAYRIGATLSGPAAGLLCAVCLFLIPRYYGHAFNNPKDIPFAVFYLWSLDGLIRALGELPRIPIRRILQLGLCVGATLGMRAPAMVLFAYLVVFFGGRLLLQTGPASHRLVALRTLLPRVAAAVVLAWTVMLLFWPWAQLSPFLRPFESLMVFSRFPEQHPSFFEGRYVISTHLPWNYALKWLLIALPEFVFLGLLGGAVACLRSGAVSRVDLRIALLVGAGLFPIGVAVVGKTPLYDGLRHLLFTIPPLVVASALGLHAVWHRLEPGRLRVGWTVLVGVLLGLAAFDLIRIHPNQSIYFNRLFAGGIREASESFETDYWQNSFRQGIRWLEDTYPPRSDGRRYRVGSLYLEVEHSLDSDRFEYVVPAERTELYLGVTRFDRHRVVPGEVLHVIRADGVPLLYIIRPDSTYREDPFFVESPFYHLRQGFTMELWGRLEEALAAYQRVLELNAGSTRHYLLVVNFYDRFGTLNQKLGRHREALRHFGMALEMDSDNAAIHNNIGISYAHLKAYDLAEQAFRKAVSLEADYYNGYVNLGNVYLLAGRKAEAEEAFRKAREIRPEAE